MPASRRLRAFAAVGLAVIVFAAIWLVVATPVMGQTNDIAPATDPASGTATEPAGGQATGPQLVVVEVNGLIDSVVASFLVEQITAASEGGALAVAVQLNSAGTTLADDQLCELLSVAAEASVPVGVWVGPSGAAARGAAAHLVSVAVHSSAAPASTIGAWSELPAGQSGQARCAQLDARPASETIFESAQAVEAGIVNDAAPSIGEFLLALSDAEIIAPISVEVEGDDGVVRRALSPEVTVSFAQPSLVDGVFHTAASPAIAYLLLLVGLSMILLDFFTGGVGVAAAVGVGSLVLSAYGLAELDTRLWALLVLVVAFAAFAVDLQSGFARFWTGVGLVALVVGSVFLFGRHSLNWLPLLVGLSLTAVFMVWGMPALIRTRYGAVLAVAGVRVGGG